MGWRPPLWAALFFLVLISTYGADREQFPTPGSRNTLQQQQEVGRQVDRDQRLSEGTQHAAGTSTSSVIGRRLMFFLLLQRA